MKNIPLLLLGALLGATSTTVVSALSDGGEGASHPPYATIENDCCLEIQGYTDPVTGKVGIEFQYGCTLGAIPPRTWWRVDPAASSEMAWEFYAAGGQ